MSLLVHIILFLVAAGVIWFFAGLLVDAVDRVAKRFHQNGFTVAFFVLGLLTSVSEMSVMVNATLDRAPDISAGNLSGASFIILLGIIPTLAIIGNGVTLRNTLKPWQLALALVVIALPTLCLLDGNVTTTEGLAAVLAYGTMLYFIRRGSRRTLPVVVEEVEETLLNRRRATAFDFMTILGGAVFIFLAGNVLVGEAVYFAGVLSVPASIIGLLILSIGTNLPELVIAVRSILKKHKDIAFGDYVGSAVANTLIFGLLALMNKGFKVEASEFWFTAVLAVIGFSFFYIFAISKRAISRWEGGVLVTFYITFVVVQCLTVLRFAIDK